MRGATLFSGGRGVECLLRDKIDFRYAVEYDPQIAAVGAQLGGHTFVGKVEDVDYSTWGALDYLHASPVCKNFSQAKAGGAETDADIDSAVAVVRCLEATQPRVFTLENVGAYQHSEAYKVICAWLNQSGYMWHAEVLNSADYGVPQTRRRLILRAVKEALLPGLPAPLPWLGWYSAIEDLLPTLPTSTLPQWITPFVKDFITGERPFLTAKHKNEWSDCVAFVDEPAMTISTTALGRHHMWLSKDDTRRADLRCFARWQTFPDWYELPQVNSLGAVVVGNAVPPLLMSQIVRPLL